MSASVTLPNTIQVRPTHLAGLLAAVAILTSVTTWSVSQVTTESHASSNPKSEVVSTQGAASTAYVDGVVALDPDQRVGDLRKSRPDPRSQPRASTPPLARSHKQATSISRRSPRWRGPKG